MVNRDQSDEAESLPIQIGVLALQGDVREHEAALRHCGQTPLRVRNPDELERVAALIIPGGESTTIAKLAVRLGLREPVIDRISRGMPVFGSCAGMVMLADRIVGGGTGQTGFGGIDMTVRRNAFGRQADSFEARLDLPALGAEPVPAVFIRAPWVERVGESVRVLATVANPGGPDRIVAVRQANLLATAFHPELTADLRLHRYFIELVRRQLFGAARTGAAQTAVARTGAAQTAVEGDLVEMGAG